MSQYLVLSHIDVQNANSIAGLTWGFPAITHFLGFTHALSRKLSREFQGDYETELDGCAVISNSIHNKVYQPKTYGDFEFLQTKNPPVLERHKVGSPPIIEEGKMNLTVSLVIELSKPLSLTSQGVKEFEKYIAELCSTMRLAGGTILAINRIRLLSANTDEQHKIMLRRVKRMTMPGFVLLDQREYLIEHYEELKEETKDINGDEPQLLDAWLDFCALKFKAHPQLDEGQTEPDLKTPAKWEYVPKPKPGYLVPLMTGYKAISDIYPAGEVENTRDVNTDTRFVEAIHSVGEWKGAHSIKNIPDVLWRYHRHGEWYLCKQNSASISNESINQVIEVNKQGSKLTELQNKF